MFFFFELRNFHKISHITKNCIEVRVNDKGRNLDFCAADKVSVHAGGDYILRFFHKGWSGFCYVLFFDKDGRQVNEPNRVGFGINASKEWTAQECKGRVPDNAVNCQIAFRSFELSKAGEGVMVDKVEFSANAK